MVEEKTPHVVLAVLCGSKACAETSRRGLKMYHLDVRKQVEASLHIGDVINQISCFLKTIVMNITLPSIH